MEQAHGQVKPGNENLVCRLNKSLYGLKQSGRTWNQTFTRFLDSLIEVGSTRAVNRVAADAGEAAR